MRAKKTIEKLNQMLDMAMNGTFTESAFDETTLSALESKWRRYLSESVVSAQNLTNEKNKIKELISDISHQTKTPISNILLYSQLLEEQELPKESKEYIEALSKQAEKLNFLIASLVKTSRLETGIIAVNPKEESIDRIFREVIAQIGPKAEKKKIALQIAQKDDKVVCDFKWTVEAIYNIVDNAIKYSAECGKVEIHIIPYDLFCKIEIKDYGIGIKEEEYHKIFSRFYRSQNVSEQEGVGIGLYLTREIITAQGGYIKVQSAIGKGSVFSVFLPRI